MSTIVFIINMGLIYMFSKNSTRRDANIFDHIGLILVIVTAVMELLINWPTKKKSFLFAGWYPLEITLYLYMIYKKREENLWNLPISSLFTEIVFYYKLYYIQK